MSGSGFHYLEVPALKARKPIKKCLMRGGGGKCMVKSGDTLRILSHRFLDRPERLPPWPLSLLQARDISYEESRWSTPRGHLPTMAEVVAAVDNMTQRRFTRWEIDAAIRLFLRDLDPSTEVDISWD